MKISQKGINIIKESEGLRLEAYLCTSKIPTIGFGNTFYLDKTPVKLGDKLKDIKQAEELLKNTLQSFESTINGLFYNITLNQNQFDALVSFVYNIGPSAFAASTLLKKAKVNPNDPAIKLEFNKWINSGGKKSKGLIKRRKLESDLYFMQ
jgi:lysozyme